MNSKPKQEGGEMNELNTNQFGCKSVDVGDGTRIDVHMANNAGRGSDNVTLTRVSVAVARPAFTRGYANDDVVAETRTSGWSGKWSLTKRVREELGL
jgi:hypothetical protein